MRHRMAALAWIDPDVSTEYSAEVVQVRRLARRLGYHLVWPAIGSVLPLVDEMRAADVDALITPAPTHLDPLTLHSLMELGDVETVWPRLSFARWSTIGKHG
ncbi:hypothetical protein [Nocardia cyriacigeorgica]|uniref:hypothetical protein n=1 Tax=Nocardia cyriacigeorgica TaxID=135487 RepID=UPI0020180E8C|nr:hypothetical protein [Nocardia cyriacigeorgica]